MDINDLRLAIAKGEDGRHQFKVDVKNVDSLAAEMTAFSNAMGGIVYIGITDKGEISGLPSNDVGRVNQLISNAAGQHVRSPITVSSENILVGQDRVVIVLTIPEGIDKPYFDNNGVVWLKSGADKRRINSKEELRRLFQDVDILHADEVPTRAGLEDLDEMRFGQFLKDVYQSTLPTTDSDKLRLLENMDLATNRQLNLAGLLLFAKTPQFYKPAFIVKAVSFAGDKITDSYIDSEDFEGPLPVIFQGALSFVLRNLRKLQGNKNVNTIGDPEIPTIALEELIVNALIHRDYFITAPVRLFVFWNRVEIVSPGVLPNHLTVEKIQAGTSIQRNPILVSYVAKGLLPYRGLGSGVRRALEAWPRTTFLNDREALAFTVTLMRPKPEEYIRT